MSTKTSIKRVALIASTALTLGSFAAINATSANATDYSVAPQVSAGSAGWYVQSAYSASTATAIQNGYATVNFVGDTGTAGETWVISLTGVGSITNGAAGTGSTANATVGGGTLTYPATSVQWTESTTAVGVQSTIQAAYTDTLTITSPTVGTTTLTATKYSNGSPTSTTAALTFNWVASTTTSVSAQYTQIGAVAGAAAPTLGTIATIVADKAAQTSAASAAATILVKPYDGGNNSMSTEKITASVSGPGTVGVGTSAQNSMGRAVTSAAAGALETITVFGDGTAGVSTITITDGTVTLGTVTVTFTGTPATVTATQSLYVMKAGATAGWAFGTTPGGATVANTPAVSLVVKDSSGNAIAYGKSGTIKVVPTDTTIIASGSCVEDTATAYAGNFYCSITAATAAASGSSTTVKFGALMADGVTYAYSAPVTFTIGGSVATEAMTLDASSYAANAPVVITVTAKDSKGNAAYDQDVALLAVGATATNYLGGNALPTTASVTLINGKHDFKGNYAPIAGNSFTISATANDVPGTALSASATVSGGAGGGDATLALDAANAATDAANNAYDEAQNATQAAQDALAAVTALAEQVKSLIASVKSLTALVSKIKAKVGA